MENNFSEEMKVKSNEELKDIVINFELNRGAITSAARKELEIRGVDLSDEEKQIIEEKKNKRKQYAISSSEKKGSFDSFNANWKRSIVSDLDAPQLYSRQVINIFSILFSVLFGGILLAINLNTVNNRKGKLPVLLFSIAYTILMIVGMNLIDFRSSIVTFALNALGAVFLYNYFWKKYIGNDFEYRTKPYWIPLVIGIVISAFLIWAAIAGIEN